MLITQMERLYTVFCRYNCKCLLFLGIGFAFGAQAGGGAGAMTGKIWGRK